MTSWSDFADDFPPMMLDERTTDRLLTQAVDPDDAPPGYAGVVRLVRAAAAPPTARELGREAEAVAAAVALRVRFGSPILAAPKRPTVRPRFFRTKVAGLVVIGFLATTIGLAAADVLPDAAQTLVSDSLARIGITVPSGDDEGSAGDERPDSKGAEISEIATTTDATGVAKGAEVSTTASGGLSRAGQHRPAHDPPAGVNTPNTGGTGTADAASGGASEQGTTIADERSDGHSSAGSDNSENGNRHGNGNGHRHGNGHGNGELGNAEGPIG